MTPEAQNIALAEAFDTLDRFVLLKRGLYWRPNAKGYTSNLSEAWILTGAEADEYIYPHDEPVTKRRAPVPEYFRDLNAQFEAWRKLTEEQKIIFGGSVERIALREGIRKEEAQYRFGCECLLRALGKWTE